MGPVLGRIRVLILEPVLVPFLVRVPVQVQVLVLGLGLVRVLVR